MKLIKFLDWDSKFFGVNIAKINIKRGKLNCNLLNSAISEAQINNIKCLYLEIPFGLSDIHQYIYENKFLLVDLKMAFKKTLNIKKNLAFRNITCEFKDEYYEHLKNIAAQISNKSRYSYDPKFGKDISAHLYEEWVRQSFYNKFCDYFFIFIHHKIPVGFFIIKIEKGIPSGWLLGVSKDMRKKGIGGCLIDYAENRLFNDGYKILKAVVHGHSIEAMKFFQKKNFEIDRITLFYHKWLD